MAPNEKNDFLRKPKYVQAAYVAYMCHVLNPPVPQRDVAKLLKVDKTYVSRLLSWARSHNLILSTLNLPRETVMEVKLVRKYRLRNAVVVPVWIGGEKSAREEFRRQLAFAGARYLDGPQTPLCDGLRVAVSCGATIRDLVMALTPDRFHGLDVSQLTIETECGEYLDQSPAVLVGMLLAKSRGRNGEKSNAFAIQPLRETLREEKECFRKYRDKMMARAQKLDVALVGVGTAKSGRANGSFGRAAETPAIKKFLKRLGAVGEICNRPFDEDGTDLFDKIPELSKHFDGVSLEVIHKLATDRTVVAVAGGLSKRKAIEVGLRRRYFNCLVTDYDTAAALCGE